MEQNKYFYSIGYMLPVFSTLKRAREYVSFLCETGDDMMSFLNYDDFGRYYIVRNPAVISDDIDMSTKFFSVDKNYRGHLVKDGFVLK